MQPALWSSTGELTHAGATWGGTLTAGSDGGTMPLAPAPGAGRATTATVDATTTAVPATARTTLMNRTRAPVRCCITLPPSSLVPE